MSKRILVTGGAGFLGRGQVDDPRTGLAATVACLEGVLSGRGG